MEVCCAWLASETMDISFSIITLYYLLFGVQ
ncbi:hypothetical protein MOVI109754_05740 [Moritella viscosa]